jgi:hypothetical protein
MYEGNSIEIHLEIVVFVHRRTDGIKKHYIRKVRLTSRVPHINFKRMRHLSW